ncbi:MAG: hypothetical protein GY705_19905, partial [Bacteroidetes bacterium]|nr:hypothetical protein [Bacteroidota bacterium]
LLCDDSLWDDFSTFDSTNDQLDNEEKVWSVESLSLPPRSSNDQLVLPVVSTDRAFKPILTPETVTLGEIQLPSQIGNHKDKLYTGPRVSHKANRRFTPYSNRHLITTQLSEASLVPNRPWHWAIYMQKSMINLAIIFNNKMVWGIWKW